MKPIPFEEAFKSLKVTVPTDTSDELEHCNNCGKLTELIDYDDGSNVPYDYRHESWVYMCTHCGFKQYMYRPFHSSGHWTGD